MTFRAMTFRAMTFRSLIIGFFTLIAFAVPAAAQTNYPWCSNFADGFGGTNCGFVSYEQCMATVRGSGGFCQENDMYKGPSKNPAAGAASARKSRKSPSPRKPS
jgi:hypothetical protein